MRRIEDDVEIDRARFWIWSRTSSTLEAVDVSCCMLPMVTYFVDRWPTKVHRFCVCAGQTVSVPVKQQGSRVWVRVEWGGAEVKPHHSVQLYFRAPCLFTLDAASIRPAGFVIYFHYESEPRSKVHSPQDSPTQNTHTHTQWDIHCLLRRVCSPHPPHPASPPARPLPAARTHIVSHCLPLSHPLWMAPRVLSFLSDFLALSLPAAACLNPSYLSMNLPISCVSMYWSPYLCPSSSLPFISSVFPQGKKGKGKTQS